MATRKNRQLLNAVYNGKIQRVKVLLEQGASPNDARDRLGSALSTAVVYRRVGIMELLLQHGADPNEPFDPDDGSLLHGAVMDTPEHKSVLAVLRHLVEHGANLEARTRDGTTPLLEAVRTTASYSQYWPSDLPGRLSVVRTLLDLGADLQAVDANGMNAVMIAQLDRDEDLVAELLRLGASSEGLNTTKLLWAVRQGDIDAVDALLKAGARPNQCFSRAGMPLADAAQQGHLEIVRRLLAAGADPNFGSPDDAPLLEATYSGHLEVMRLLLEAGADPNRARRASSSLLSYAKLGKREGHKPGQPWDEVIELVRTACGRATLRLHSADPEDSFLSSLWQETEAPADLVWHQATFGSVRIFESSEIDPARLDWPALRTALEPQGLFPVLCGWSLDDVEPEVGKLSRALKRAGAVVGHKKLLKLVAKDAVARRRLERAPIPPGSSRLRPPDGRRHLVLIGGAPEKAVLCYQFEQYHLDAREVASILAAWRKRVGAELMAFDRDTMDLWLPETVTDADQIRRLALEMRSFAPDIDGLRGPLSAAASRQWSFWWD